MKIFNYRMIELARTARGKSQKELAALLPKLNQPNLSKIERGEMAITDEDLSNVAEVLNFPVDFFYQEDVKTPLANMYFRKRTTLPVKALDRIFAEVKIILKGIDYLMSELEEMKQYAQYRFDISEGWTPESVAVRMREILQYHEGRPITNIVTKIEDLGIIVFFYDSPHDKFDGLTSYTDSGVPVIFVNKNMPNDRVKFTIIHELFHLVMHIPCNIEPWRDVENEANQATSEFVMPAKHCLKDLQNLSYNRLGIVKSYWGVSKAAIVRRAKDLGAITNETYKYLMIELGRRNERKVEQGFVDIDYPAILPTIINLLRTEREYDTQHLCGMLRLPQWDYSRFFDPQSRPNITLKALRNTA